jgi:hypothetical protein
MELQMEHKTKNSIEIEVPLMVQTKISFEFNPSSPYGIDEALAIFVESEYFDIPLTERGNSVSSLAGKKRIAPINLSYNTSNTPQTITISGSNKVYHGARTWVDSDSKLLRDKPFEKIIGFNSIAQPDNYEAMICNIVFYL